MSTIKERLSSLGHELPPAPTPAANYIPFTTAGNLLSISGQISKTTGEVMSGTLSSKDDIARGKKAAEAAALNILAQIAAATDGTLASVRQVLKLGIFVAADPGFQDHPLVANGASDLIAAVFGDAGRHSRTTVGVASLPSGALVEIDALIKLEV